METTGTYKTCTRCKGTGEARYNHMNGDTHCYLCNGEGIRYSPTAAEKAREAADAAWHNDSHMRLVGGSGSYRNQIRRPLREATETTPYERTPADPEAYEASREADRAAALKLERRITFWVEEAREEMAEEQGREKRERQAAALAAARQDPKLAAKIAKAWDAYIAAAPNEFEASLRTRMAGRKV